MFSKLSIHTKIVILVSLVSVIVSPVVSISMCIYCASLLPLIMIPTSIVAGVIFTFIAFGIMHLSEWLGLL